MIIRTNKEKYFYNLKETIREIIEKHLGPVREMSINLPTNFYPDPDDDCVRHSIAGEFTTSQTEGTFKVSVIVCGAEIYFADDLHIEH